MQQLRTNDRCFKTKNARGLVYADELQMQRMRNGRVKIRPGAARS